MLKKLIKSLVSQKLINNYYHLPRALMANIWYGFPTKKLTVIGVTGTDGKTTTANMIYSVLKDAEKKVSLISTINAVIGGKVYETGFHVTSPNPFLVQKLAKDASKNKDQYLILEVTSHALDQYRVWGIKFDIGVVTNITHEHLDYHKTFENYQNTKFKLIKNAKYAIVNKNIKLPQIRAKKITFGQTMGDFNQKDLKLRLKIPGIFNIENALASMAVAFILDIPKNLAQKSLEKFEGIPGRMEEMKNSKDIIIVVDFAHTPNALEKALQTLKSRLKRGKLIAVFGAASERDVAKRPIMGEISSRLADITILTDEDPRFEDRNKIIGEILKGVKKKAKVYAQPDREEAIKLAISMAKKGDIIGIFGKGHERSMNYKGVEIPWSDQERVESILDGYKI